MSYTFDHPSLPSTELHQIIGQSKTYSWIGQVIDLPGASDKLTLLVGNHVPMQQLLACDAAGPLQNFKPHFINTNIAADLGVPAMTKLHSEFKADQRNALTIDSNMKDVLPLLSLSKETVLPLPSIFIKSGCENSFTRQLTMSLFE